MEDESKREEQKQIVIAKPVSLGEATEVDYRAPKILFRIITLFKNGRSKSDLDGFQVPPVFNLPKSQLQCFGEPLYSFSGEDLLSKCNAGETPIQRLKSVVVWSISTLRPLTFGVGPYNPILGETHHVSRGNLNILLEQVSHHPPVSAVHATNERDNIELISCHHPVPKLRGTSVEIGLKGKKQLKLLNHGETYEMNLPKMVIRFVPVSGAEWAGKIRIRCQENGLEAELNYNSSSLMGIRGNSRSIKGKIFESVSGNVLYEISGQWDRKVSAKDLKTGNVEDMYNATEVLHGLRAPTVTDSKELLGTESAVVWNEVTKAILSKDWEIAGKAKKCVEDKQRETLKLTEGSDQAWVPKHFSLTRVSPDDDENWECSPLQKWVPPSSIVVPL